MKAVSCTHAISGAAARNAAVAAVTSARTSSRQVDREEEPHALFVSRRV